MMNINKILLSSFLVLSATLVFGQSKPDSMNQYKKRVLENIEVDFMTSYYSQDGNNSSVGGGVGNEKLTDFTPTIVVSIPLNDNNVLTIDAGISAYSSASSSNLDPFDASGASTGYEDDEEEDGEEEPGAAGPITGSPWVESSGESAKDTWASLNLSYSHSSNDRNSIVILNASTATEYDYFSIGFGAGYTRLFNEKNTELSIRGSVYLDTWHPKYPTEMDSYLQANGNLNNGFFSGVDILNEAGKTIDKNGSDIWSPINSQLLTDEIRNAYALSLSFSQIISKNAQFSIFVDVIQQDGWLGNPSQRVYFADRPNYYIGNADHIPFYDSPQNTQVFQLADDIERLPSTRLKYPIGGRFNYYVNEWLVLKSYYRFYADDWGVTSHTASLNVPIKLSPKFTVRPGFRYYSQTAADYFAPYEQNLSTQEFYTSDYDLSAFNSSQLSLGVSYTDLFTRSGIGRFKIKSIDVKYSKYDRNSSFTAGIISAGIKFVID